MAGLSSKDEAQARSNYFDLKRDETMALNEYLKSPVAVKDLKSNPAPKGRKKGGTTAKKHIMELPTNVPRLQKGASMIADINKNGKIEGWEQARSDAIQKNMKNKKVTKARDGNVRMSDQDKALIASYKNEVADARMSDQDKKVAIDIMSGFGRMSDQDKKIAKRRLNTLFKQS